LTYNTGKKMTHTKLNGYHKSITDTFMEVNRMI